MTKTQIKAELRRSAAEDADPWRGVDIAAFNFAYYTWLLSTETLLYAQPDDLRTFFLLVAEAM